MIYVKTRLNDKGFKALDFISYLCDGKRNLNLEEYKGKEMVKIVRNGEEGKIYINEDLEPVLNEFLKG
jgi:hypothetical protein